MEYEITNQYPDNTIRLEMGVSPNNIMIDFVAKRTALNRFKYWLFSQFFPFKVEWL